jgi:hypothetical protein
MSKMSMKTLDAKNSDVVSLLKSFVLSIFAILIAFTWLVIPFVDTHSDFFDPAEKKVDLALRSHENVVRQHFSHIAYGPGEANVDVLFAAPEYFKLSQNAVHFDLFRPDRYLIFYAMESIDSLHHGMGAVPNMQPMTPEFALYIDGEKYEPDSVDIGELIGHMRANTIYFSLLNRDGTPRLSGSSRKLIFTMSNIWDMDGGEKRASWRLPLKIPEVLREPKFNQSNLQLAIFSHFYSEPLLPALFILTLAFVMAMGGFGFNTAHPTSSTISLSSNPFHLAIGFIIGFAVLFLFAESVHGLLADMRQAMFVDQIELFNRIAGFGVLMIGCMVGVRNQILFTTRPIAFNTEGVRIDWNAVISLIILGATFAIVIENVLRDSKVTTLFVYTDTLFSWSSVGLVVLSLLLPLILSALLLSRAFKNRSFSKRFSPIIHMSSMLVLIVIGSFLIMNQLGLLSAWLGMIFN